MRHFNRFLFLFLLCTGSFAALAQGGEGRQMQEDPPYQPPKNVKTSFFRKALSKVNFGLSTGYGYSLYRQNLSGYSVFSRSDAYYLVPENQISYGRVNLNYEQWLNDPLESRGVVPVEGVLAVTGDTINLGLKGSGSNLPFHFNLSVDLAERYKIGGGIGAEFYSIGDMRLSGWEEAPAPYKSGVKTAIMLRYYGSFAARASRWYFWDFSPELQVGQKKFITQYNQDLISGGFFYNGGLLIERHFSEYFRLTIRPSAEWSSYNMNLEAADRSLTTNTPSFYLQAGISFNFPRLPSCPVNPCQAQLEHVHGGKEYRGQPIYRWQNPKYGQNHPELMRNKKRKKDDTEQRLQHKKKRRRKFFLW